MTAWAVRRGTCSTTGNARPARGADLGYGRTLPRLLREAGLEDVRADAFFPLTSPACTALELATIDQVRDRLVSGGIATDAEVERYRASLVAGRVPDLATAPMISAWGRKTLTADPPIISDIRA